MGVIFGKISWAEQREQILRGQGGRWFKRSERASGCRNRRSVAALGYPDYKSLRLYDRLRKAESSILFQARTDRIGLRGFLASAKVPQIDSGELGVRFEQLVSEADSGARVARQLIRSGKLGQYSLAAQLLYTPGDR
ncbi:zinc knuckle protein [Rutstroemia sp. NJR-2017a WRK4]|nr:zinc knuckle protein [Rutstroemia sp. NJR-2017a WRK4]